MRPAPSPTPTLIAGRYRLDAVLGRGGMGEVYRATDLQSGTKVAVKVMRSADDDTQRASGRFIREARQTAALSHPNIIRALDFGQVSPGTLFLVIELLEGEALSKLVNREGRLPAERVVHIAEQLCAALGAVHAAGIVHRDVKPANAMRVPTAADPDFMKLIDFGIARGDVDETQFTGTGMMVGTTDYASPEQILGRPLDGRSDQYAMGVMLYRLLAGVLPFEGPGAAALVHQHLEKAPVPLTERVPDAAIPRALDAVVLRCLAKQPNARHASMEELAAALRSALEARADAATLTAPVAHARLGDVGELELDVRATAAGTGADFRRCARCASENSRFTTHCARCGADLGTPDQLAFMAGVLAQARAEAAPSTHDAVDTVSLRPRLPAPTPAAVEPAVRPNPFVALLAPLRILPPGLWKRVLGYSIVGLVVTRFLFFGDGVTVAFAGGALLGAIGVAAHALDDAGPG